MSLVDWCPEPDGLVDVTIFLFPFIVGLLGGFFGAFILYRKRVKQLEGQAG